MYFLVTSVDFKIFEENCESLFHYYSSELANTIKSLDIEEQSPYGLEELLQDFEKYKLFFVYELTNVVPICWADAEDLSSNISMRNISAVVKSEKYISFFNGWISFFFSGMWK